MPGGSREAIGDDRELKVRVPMSLMLKLHTAKVLRGQLISDTVRIALERYFDDEPVRWTEADLVPVGVAPAEPPRKPPLEP